MDISDADLIARVLLNDDRNAFATLVRRYQSGVRNLLRRLCKGDVALADDLAQETFIKVYKALASFRGQAKLNTWLYRIAYNAFISDNRRKKEFLQLDEGLHADEQQQPPTQAVTVDLREDLLTAMNRLTNQERIAIQFCYQDGFSHSEAAAVLGLPIGTIKTHISRGREKLRQHLAAWQETICYER